MRAFDIRTYNTHDKILLIKDLRFIPFITHEYSRTIKKMKRSTTKHKFKTVWPRAQKNTVVYTYTHMAYSKATKRSINKSG